MRNTIPILLFLLVLVTQGYAQQSSCNCCTAQHRQFDFWAGSWEVYGPAGKLVGKNVIEIAQDSCLLIEHWESNGGKFTGTSFNYFEPSDSSWNQLWIDNQASNLRLKGMHKANQMIMDDSDSAPPGSPVNRITWTANDDGTVRQLWEQVISPDSVSVLFDGIYKRVKSN